MQKPEIREKARLSSPLNERITVSVEDYRSFCKLEQPAMLNLEINP
jgi:hypothetical protein